MLCLQLHPPLFYTTLLPRASCDIYSSRAGHSCCCILLSRQTYKSDLFLLYFPLRPLRLDKQPKLVHSRECYYYSLYLRDIRITFLASPSCHHLNPSKKNVNSKKIFEAKNGVVPCHLQTWSSPSTVSWCYANRRHCTGLVLT